MLRRARFTRKRVKHKLKNGKFFIIYSLKHNVTLQNSYFCAIKSYQVENMLKGL